MLIWHCQVYFYKYIFINILRGFWKAKKMKTIHLRATLEKLIFDACIPAADASAPGRFLSGLVCNVRGVSHHPSPSHMGKLIKRALSPPASISVAPSCALC